MPLQRGAEQAELREPRHELDRKARGGEAVGDDRQHFAVDEARDGILDQPLVLAEQRSDVVEIERIERAHETRRAATEAAQLVYRLSF